MGGATSISWTENAEVFTKPSVALYMIDEIRLAGHFRHWYRQRVLEPSCGRGAFVLPLVEVLVKEHEKGTFQWTDPILLRFLKAVDISRDSIDYLRDVVVQVLIDNRCPPDVAHALVREWFLCDDFLIHDFAKEEFDVIVGNPPYIRFDDIPREVLTVYQLKYFTFTDRCDIYVPFIERSLRLLSKHGVLSFICANRFVKNRYGRALRRMVTSSYHTRLYLNVEHAHAFVQKVSAYPAIIVLDRRLGEVTYAGEISDIGHLCECKTSNPVRLSRFTKWYNGEEPWVSTAATAVRVWRVVTSQFPTLEASAVGTKIGIGVATGADKVFLLGEENGIEADCKLPVVCAKDVKAGRIEWNARFMLNPYDSTDSRKMRNLDSYPKTRKYVMRFEGLLKKRHCARMHPQEWFRTIDRINYNIWRSPKVLMPDIQLGGVAAIDSEGNYYPHHNVYYIMSSGWNLRALCTIMRSAFVTEQLRKLSVSMRGGSIRYQSQNLKLVHIPHFSSLLKEEVNALDELADSCETEKIDTVMRSVVNRLLTNVAHDGRD